MMRHISAICFGLLIVTGCGSEGSDISPAPIVQPTSNAAPQFAYLVTSRPSEMQSYNVDNNGNASKIGGPIATGDAVETFSISVDGEITRIAPGIHPNGHTLSVDNTAPVSVFHIDTNTQLQACGNEAF
jgi:hypothetical protein